MNIVGFIFARGGSKGVPRKNVRLLGGKPLIAHAIETAFACRQIGEVIVSTDDPEIADVAMDAGASVPFLRPAELSTDSAPEWLAWRHAIEHYTRFSQRGPVDVFVSVPTTAPLRIVDDVERCIDALTGDPDRPDVILTVAEPYRNPYFNMVTTDVAGRAKLVCTSPDGNAFRRQDAPPVFDITTVAYALRAEYILTASRMLAGQVKTVTVPVERSLDIDTEHDLFLAECLWQRRQSPTKKLRAA
ncbi:MAG TPA: acylneuraminate cytidylyltransferase family protein [Planctomycetaceae bacterium]|nr:acylneuraminate cytidylyltransferase family protein [Planctomycetaceae bacterium]